MLQLNLLPNVKKELLHAKRMRNLVMTVCIFVSIGAGAVVLALGIWLGGLAVQKSLISGDVDKNIAKIETEKSKNQLNDYLSIQNDLTQIDAIKGGQPQLSRVVGYLDVVFGRTTPIAGLSWNDWTEIKLTTAEDGTGIGIELTGQTTTTESRLMLRNRLYYATLKYSEYSPGDSGTVKEGDTKTDQKLFPDMIPTIDFEGGSQDDTTGKWPFKATLIFNPIAFKTSHHIQAIEVDSCKVWSATYGTIGEGCQGKVSQDDLLPSQDNNGGNAQ